jgi:hypothetical protein
VIFKTAVDAILSGKGEIFQTDITDCGTRVMGIRTQLVVNIVDHIAATAPDERKKGSAAVFVAFKDIETHILSEYVRTLPLPNISAYIAHYDKLAAH